MKKILIIIGLAMAVNFMFAQSWVVFKLDSICDPPVGTVEVSLLIADIDTSGLLGIFGLNITYEAGVLDLTNIELNPVFSSSSFLFNFLDNYPYVGWNTIMMVYTEAISVTFSPGTVILDFEFNYYWGSTDLIFLNEPTAVNGFVGICQAPQPTATLKIGTLYDPLPGTTLVPITCEAIDNPLIGNNLVSSFGWYVAYDTSVLYAGEPNSPATLVNYNPEFSQSSYLTNIVADNPFPGWNTIAIIYACACSGEVYPGDKFFDIQFSYSEGSTTEPNIIWTSLSGFETNMADDEGNEFFLTLMDGYVGPYYAFDVLFHVTDNTGMPLEDALVIIDSLSVLTDANGMAAFSLTNGTYDYIISKENYMPETGSFTVAGSAITIEETLNPLYGVTFHVTDDGNDLEGAMVTVGNDSIATNSSGLAVFNLPDGDYSYTVTKTGYADEEGIFTVAGAPLQIEVEMEHCWDITFHVFGCDSATISINGDTLITNGNGIATICLPNGWYSFSVTCPGYNSSSGNIMVNNAAMTINILLVPITYDVTFFINCCGEPLAGISITIGTVTIVTSASGHGIFNLSLGSYTYYIGNISGNFTVPPPAYIDVDLCSETTFHVTNEQGSPIQGVNIEIGGENLVTDFYGEADTCLQVGTYSYTATKFGYISQTGSFEVDTIPQTVEIVMQPVTYAVTFSCGVSCENQFNGWHCNINGEILYSGETIYLPTGMWDFTLSWLGCWLEVGVIYVQGPTAITCMGLGEPHVTFHVSSTQGGNLQNATVIVDTFALMTNSSGEATFCLPGGYHNYTIIKEGFDTLTGTFNYLDYCQDTLIEILMNPVLVNVNTSSDFCIYPNPSDGIFYFDNTGQWLNQAEISVTDVTARIVYRQSLMVEDKMAIDLSVQPKGIYFLRIKSGEEVFTRKLIKH